MTDWGIDELEFVQAEEYRDIIHGFFDRFGDVAGGYMAEIAENH